MCIGNSYKFDKTVTINQGSKSETDYTLTVDGNQFTDYELFFDILNSSENISNFLVRMRNSSFLNFEQDALLFEGRPETLYDSLEEKTAKDRNFFLSILRIDIDNQCYPPPNYNGGIRHFAQLILLNLLKNDQFDLSWITNENIKHFVNKNKNKNLANAEIAKIVHDAGFPYSGITKNDWSDLYSDYIA